VRVEVPDPPGRLVLSRDAVRPVDGLIESATVPENPWIGATVMVDVAWAPGFNPTMLMVLEERVKSWT